MNRGFQLSSLEPVRKIVGIWLGLTLVLVLVVAVILGASLRNLMGFALLLSVLSLLGGAGVIWHLYTSYRRHPLVLDKEDCLRQLPEVIADLEATKDLIPSLEGERQRIDRQEQTDVRKAHARHAETIRQLEAKVNRANADEARDLQQALDDQYRLQLAHYLAGISILENHIPGLMPDQLEQLDQAGIQTAAEITIESLSRLSGFREADLAALLEWRQQVERSAQIPMPERPPTEQEAAIFNHYARTRAGIEHARLANDEALQAELANIQEKSAQMRTWNELKTEKAHQQLIELAEEARQLQLKIQSYQNITPLRYLQGCLPSPKGLESAPAMIGLVPVVGLAVLVPLVQSFLAVGSTASQIAAAMAPSATPTIFATTAAPTLAPTQTRPATVTAAAVEILPPTFTLVPTETLVPTLAATPTITLTPTATLTPTVTLPANDGAACVPTNTERVVAEVRRIVDGDTVMVVIGRTQYYVHYIGVNAPHYGSYIEPYAREAVARNRELVEGKLVTLVKDVSEVDAYNQLLRYVLVDGVLVNQALVADGLAQIDPRAPDQACDAQLAAAQDQAQQSALGLWGPTPTPTP